MSSASEASVEVEIVGRAALSRERLAAAALTIIDIGGVEKLSMRRLGSALGIEAMSLYHYIDNKDDLLDAVVDVLYQEIELSDLEAMPWPEGFRATSVAFYEVLTEHPNAIELISTHSARSPTMASIMHWAWASFRDAGLTGLEAMTVFRSLVSFVLGFASTQLGVLGGTDNNLLPVNPGSLADADMARMVETNSQYTARQLFDEGLELMIAGVEHRYGIRPHRPAE